MKVTLEQTVFSPVTLVLESQQEVNLVAKLFGRLSIKAEDAFQVKVGGVYKALVKHAPNYHDLPALDVVLEGETPRFR